MRSNLYAEDRESDQLCEVKFVIYFIKTFKTLMQHLTVNMITDFD